jgi:predicted AlkP superfamily pyrophosphatase or phosphodiesterase
MIFSSLSPKFCSPFQFKFKVHMHECNKIPYFKYQPTVSWIMLLLSELILSIISLVIYLWGNKWVHKHFSFLNSYSISSFILWGQIYVFNKVSHNKVISERCTFLYLFIGCLINLVTLIDYENKRSKWNFQGIQQCSKHYHKYICLFILFIYIFLPNFRALQILPP